jgi:hypothetical protein
MELVKFASIMLLVSGMCLEFIARDTAYRFWARRLSHR